MKKVKRYRFELIILYSVIVKNKLPQHSPTPVPATRKKRLARSSSARNSHLVEKTQLVKCHSIMGGTSLTRKVSDSSSITDESRSVVSDEISIEGDVHVPYRAEDILEKADGMEKEKNKETEREPCLEGEALKERIGTIMQLSRGM